MSSKVSESNKLKFASAMVNLVYSIKRDTENCTKLCGVVNEKELTVIDFVGTKGNVKMSEIAETMEVPLSTLTTIVDKLVDRNLINREHSGEDRRVINVSLSKEGKVAFNRLMDKKLRMSTKILSDLSEKEQALIIKHLNHLASLIGTV